MLLALDVAASEFHSDGVYAIDGGEMDAAGLVAYYTELADKYPLYSIEDGLDENDWAGWKQLTDALGSKVQLVMNSILSELVTR